MIAENNFRRFLFRFLRYYIKQNACFRQISEIKQVLRSVSVNHCRQVADRTLLLESARDVKTYLKEELTKILPELPIYRIIPTVEASCGIAQSRSNGGR